MPSPFQAAGAQADPSRSAPLHTNRFFTGLWTQRSPLRDAATPYLYEKFYSASRFDSLIGGVNSEITTRLTLARRPGQSIYNSQSLPPFNRLYPFRTFQNGIEVIRVVGDFQPDAGNPYGTVRDVTGPSTNLVLWQKLKGSGKTAFQAVGSELFFVDGVSQRKLVTSTTAWAAAEGIGAGVFIVDAVNNIQYSVNGGVTGATYPAFATAFGATTTDGSVTWINKGSASQTLGTPGPQAPPNVYQAPLSMAIPPWVADTWYSPLPATLDPGSTNTVQILTTAGSYGSSYPTFSATPGATTTDGSLVWTCQGPNTWQANTFYGAGTILYMTPHISGQVQTLSTFQVVQAGTSGATAPAWLPGFGSSTLDGTVTWQNFGSADQRTTTQNAQQTQSGEATPLRGFVTQLLDSNAELENIISPGLSGTSAPMWATMTGATTIAANVTAFEAAVWINAGNAGVAGTAQWYYAYAWKSSVTGHVTTASPKSLPIVVGTRMYIIVQALASPDPHYDTIVIYRTNMGGATLFELAEIASPGASALWTYADTSDGDLALNILIQAQIAGSSNPPPANLSTLTYHLGRLFGYAGNVLYYSGGPDTLTGSGNEAWPALNTFTLPSQGVRAWATSVGLIAFTQSDVYIVLGQGTNIGNNAKPLYLSAFQEGVGLLSYDAFAVNGSTAYLMTTAYRLISFDPGAGETEPGFPIGDLLAKYSQASTVLAYHEGSTADTALYAADGAVGWYRMSTVNAPESGMVWSTQAQVIGGVHAVASVEISPGVKKLLVSTAAAGPILMRDATNSADVATPFPCYTAIGSVVLAQPGQIAGVEFLTTDSIVAGTRPTIGLLLGELSGTPDLLTRSRQDPTLLPPSKTIWGDRYYMSQNQTIAWCRHMQVTIQWPTEAAPNELLSYTIFGEIKNELEGAA